MKVNKDSNNAGAGVVATKEFKLDLDNVQVGEVISKQMQSKIQNLKDRIDSVRAKQPT